MINDILDLSKIEAGRMELSLGEFDMPAAVDNAITLFVAATALGSETPENRDRDRTGEDVVRMLAEERKRSAAS